MSQLKKCFLLVVIIAITTTSYIVFAKASQKSLRAEIESPYKWGKSVGPIQLRIEDKGTADGVTSLEGQISTKLSTVNIEWKLPEGVTLVSGQLNETVQRSDGDGIITRTITVKSAKNLKKPHVVFSVHSEDDGHRRGNTAVFNLQKTDAEVEKTQNIQQYMKSRGAQPMK